MDSVSTATQALEMSQHDPTTALCENLTTTPELRNLLHDFAPLLGTQSALESITWAKGLDKSVEVFRYGWISELSDNLTNEVIKTVSSKVKERVDTIAGAKIKEWKKGDPEPQIVLMNEAMLSSNDNEFHLLQPIPISETTYKNIIRRIQALLPNLQPQAYAPKDTMLRVQGDVNREVAGERRFLWDESSLIYGSVRYRTVPRLMPFLMVPILTERN